MRARPAARRAMPQTAAVPRTRQLLRSPRPAEGPRVMADESRGKRRKQANPRRNRGKREGKVWSKVWEGCAAEMELLRRAEVSVVDLRTFQVTDASASLGFED